MAADDELIVLSKRAGTQLWRRNEHTQQLERVVNFAAAVEERALADGIVLRREPNGTLWRRAPTDDEFVCVWRGGD